MNGTKGPTQQYYILLAAAAVIVSGLVARADTFRSRWPDNVERPWAGKHYWTNPLQDWQLEDGRLHCTVTQPNREAALLTHAISAGGDGFTTSVRLRIREGDGWAGVCVGAKGDLSKWPDLADYRDNAVLGDGLNAGLTADGTLFIGEPDGAPSEGSVNTTVANAVATRRRWSSTRPIWPLFSGKSRRGSR